MPNLAVIGAGATVGPFSYLRPGTKLGAQGKIGGFVETKNADIGDRRKVPHLTYAGDAPSARAPTSAPARSSPTTTASPSTTPRSAARVHREHTRHRRPVHVGDGAYVAAGSAIVNDVEPGQLAVARGRQRNIDGWVSAVASAPRPPMAAEARPASARASSSRGPGRRTTSDATTTLGHQQAPEKQLMVFSGRATRELAQEVAEALGTELVPTSAYDFANGEIYVRYEESVRGCDAFVIQSHTARSTSGSWST